MRVLILNYEYPPLGGGAGVALRYLLGGLSAQRDQHIDVVTSGMGADHTELFSDRIRLHVLDIGKTGSPHVQSNAELVTYSARAYLYARRLLRRQDADVVHAFFGIPCGYLAMHLGRPYIVSLRGSDVPFYNARFETLDKLFFERTSRRIWRRAARVIANSEGLRELALRTAPEQPIDVIYNAVDTDFFCPPPSSSYERPIEPTPRPLSLVSCGRLIPRKGYHVLIRALAGMDDVILRIIGDGTEREALAQLAADLGVSVELVGRQDRETVRTLLQAADVFVLPSLNEGMSNAVLEAMACGLPIVATDVGGSRELIRDNGVIVPKEDPDALRAALSSYASNPDQVRRHRDASRIRALDMRIEAMAERYRKVYETV